MDWCLSKSFYKKTALRYDLWIDFENKKIISNNDSIVECVFLEKLIPVDNKEIPNEKIHSITEM